VFQLGFVELYRLVVILWLLSVEESLCCIVSCYAAGFQLGLLTGVNYVKFVWNEKAIHPKKQNKFSLTLPT
jgi:hypothetical protein